MFNLVQPPWLFADYTMPPDTGEATRTTREPIYFMARGTVEMRVEMETVVLAEGEVVVIEPGEAHTFLSGSPDHFHFVVQVPGLEGEEARTDKTLVPRSRLGL